MKWWMWLVLTGVAVVGLAAWQGLSFKVPVEVAAVTTGDIREFVEERGKTRLPKEHLITMPFDGRIAAIDLTEGAPVSQGEVVARIVPKDVELSVHRAQAAVDRLDASIRENDDTSVENTTLEQAVQFVESMLHTVEAAAARVRAGQARMEFAEKLLTRVRELSRTGAQTQEDLDRAEVEQVESAVDFQQDKLVHAAMESMHAATALTPTAVRQFIARKTLKRDVLEKERAEAEANLELRLVEQERSVMHSPLDGVVLERLHDNERPLSMGTVLMRLGDLRQLEVEAEILSRDVVRIRPGQPAEIFGPAIGPKPVAGTVHRIYPAGFTKVSSLGVEQQRVLVILRFEPEVLQRLLKERELGVDYRVEVKVFTAESSQALTIPRTALFRGADASWQVFAVQDGAAQLRRVRIGLMNDRAAEVLEGLQAGDRVILAPESTLEDGTLVRPVAKPTNS